MPAFAGIQAKDAILRPAYQWLLVRSIARDFWEESRLPSHFSVAFLSRLPSRLSKCPINTIEQYRLHNFQTGKKGKFVLKKGKFLSVPLHLDAWRGVLSMLPMPLCEIEYECPSVHEGS